MADPSAGLDVVALVSSALAAGRESAGALVLPTILLDRDQLGEGKRPGRGADLANVVAAWFREYGFYAERSHVGGHGYGENIKEIMFWDRDDSEALRGRFEGKLAQQDALLAELDVPPKEPSVRKFERELFEEKLALRQVMTEEQCEACYNAIFESYSDEDGTWTEDFREGAGAPDLLVWSSDPSQNMWFFCEVKSHNDRLRATQHDWLRRSWSQIGGRFLLLLLGS